MADRMFVNDGNAVNAVWQSCMGAKFRAVRYQPWPDSRTEYLHILDEDGRTIGEANDYLYSDGYTLYLCDGSYSGFVSREQIVIVN